jgi:acetylornithine deacetylase
MIGAAHKLVLAGGLKAGKLVIAAVADEEHASLGARELVKEWQADGAVIPEPTDLQIGLGHRGFSWVEVATQGVAAHGSRPRDGRDAIFRMGRVLNRLEELDRELQGQPPHPVQGTASLHASLIDGGRELSSYPDNCVLQFERRTTSDEPEGIAMQQINQILAELKKGDPEFEGSAKLILEQSPFEIPTDHGLVVALRGAISRSGRTPKQGRLSFWTDAALLAGAGIPTVVFGPGGAGLHSTEEFVYMEDVLACRDVLADLASTFCAKPVILNSEVQLRIED